MYPGIELVQGDAEANALAHTSAASDEVAAVWEETAEAMPRPEIAAGLVETRLLEALVVATRAKRVLDVGTFTGASARWRRPAVGGEGDHPRGPSPSRPRS